MYENLLVGGLGGFFILHGHSDVSMDESAYHSGIRYWNTEAKLIFSLAAVIFVVVLDRAPISVFTFCYMGAVNI